MPKSLSFGHGKFDLADSLLLAIGTNSLFPEAQFAQRGFDDMLKISCEIVVDSDYTNAILSLHLDSTVLRPQGYRLAINDNGIAITGADATGVYYPS
jgi:hypothetical protein